MFKTLLLSAIAVLAVASQALAASDRPNIVLVHRAFAEGARWDKVAAKLKADHYLVIVGANQLRSVDGGAAPVTALWALYPKPSY